MAEYCLRWNNHQPNLVTVFSELLTAESLVDVTLAADGHFIHAHRLVLSACSVYFKDLFNGTNSWKHPIVFLKDIRIEDLKTVIDFIYRGEVNVSQERLQDVLKTAESLRIKGLADKPFNYEDYPSQARGQHLSSSFSSQRSSLTDSREQLLSVDAEDAADVSSPPHSKKRKLISQESSESAHDSSQETDERVKNSDSKEDSSRTTPSANEELSKAPSVTIKAKIKEESDTSAETPAGCQESRAADAMLLLQGSSSDGGGDEGGTPNSGGGPTNSSRDGVSGLISPQSQGNLDWSLSLGHWWASVLPALAQHHHSGPPQPPLHPSPYLSSTSRNTRHHASNASLSRPHDLTISRARGVGNGSSSTSREGSPASGAQLVVGSLDQLSLVSALGKEISPQMVQALQAVAARRESFSSAAKLYSVSVTTLWRYFRKLGLSDSNSK